MGIRYFAGFAGGLGGTSSGWEKTLGVPFGGPARDLAFYARNRGPGWGVLGKRERREGWNEFF